MARTDSPVGSVAFMSYSHHDDVAGSLSKFHDRLVHELRAQSGIDIKVFKDDDDIELGDRWHDRLEQGLATSTFLLPIITPSFLTSKYCRHEFDTFLEHERDHDRDDLVLPVYYIDCSYLSAAADEPPAVTLRLVLERQYFDWRKVRILPPGHQRTKQARAELATGILKAMARTAADQPTPLVPDEPTDDTGDGGDNGDGDEGPESGPVAIPTPDPHPPRIPDEPTDNTGDGPAPLRLILEGVLVAANAGLVAGALADSFLTGDLDDGEQVVKRVQVYLPVAIAIAIWLTLRIGKRHTMIRNVLLAVVIYACAAALSGAIVFAEGGEQSDLARAVPAFAVMGAGFGALMAVVWVPRLAAIGLGVGALAGVVVALVVPVGEWSAVLAVSLRSILIVGLPLTGLLLAGAPRSPGST